MTVVNMGIAKIVAILPVRRCQKKLQRRGWGPLTPLRRTRIQQKKMRSAKSALRQKLQLD